MCMNRCYFSVHDKTILIGGSSSNIADRCICVTIHHCFFDGTKQRHPRVRFGKVHLYNNYTRNWSIYAVCASVESQVCANLKFSNPLLLKSKRSLLDLIHCYFSASDCVSVQYL